MKTPTFIRIAIRTTGVCVLPAAVLSHCSHAPSFSDPLVPTLSVSSVIEPEEAYEVLRKKWTITLGEQGQASSRGLPLRTPFAGSNGNSPGGRFGEFPVAVTATLMDPVVIEAGIQYYGDLLSMSKNETDQFRERYYETHEIENMIFIWLDVATSYSDAYLDLDRWAIFIEDDQGNQYESKRVVEIPVSVKSGDFDRLVEETKEEGPFRLNSFPWTIHEKYVLLYFPRVDFLGNPVVTEDTEFLKLVFSQWGKKDSKAEGFWQFSRR